MLEETNELKDLKVGHQGTNFSATEEQFESFLDLINSRTLGAYGKISPIAGWQNTTVPVRGAIMNMNKEKGPEDSPFRSLQGLIS